MGCSVCGLSGGVSHKIDKTLSALYTEEPGLVSARTIVQPSVYELCVNHHGTDDNANVSTRTFRIKTKGVEGGPGVLILCKSHQNIFSQKLVKTIASFFASAVKQGDSKINVFFFINIAFFT